MVRHIVVWRLKDFAALTPESQPWAALQKSAAAMRAGVPGVLKLDVGLDQSRTPESADLILFSEFESWAALEGYQVHPLHEDFKKVLGPLRNERRMIDYEIP